ncbi:MAG: hypothetical protein ABIQ61_08280 [Ornithinibacter sp.]
MRKIFVVLIGLMLAAFTATSAQAASPHYVKGPSVTVSGNSLVVSFKAAGLGSTVDTADFTLTGTVTATAQCYTRSGNPVNGVPKTDTTNVEATGTFDVRNGQTTGSFTVSPVSSLKCTGNQSVRILSVSYDLTLDNVYLGSTHLVG